MINVITLALALFSVSPAQASSQSKIKNLCNWALQARLSPIEKQIAHIVDPEQKNLSLNISLPVTVKFHPVKLDSNNTVKTPNISGRFPLSVFGLPKKDRHGKLIFYTDTRTEHLSINTIRTLSILSLPIKSKTHQNLNHLDSFAITDKEASINNIYLRITKIIAPFEEGLEKEPMVKFTSANMRNGSVSRLVPLSGFIHLLESKFITKNDLSHQFHTELDTFYDGLPPEEQISTPWNTYVRLRNDLSAAELGMSDSIAEEYYQRLSKP